MTIKRFVLSAFFLIAMFQSPSRAQSTFTQQDRELLIQLKTTLTQIDKRFEQIDKRFEQIDKRFEQIDIRFIELREDMNKRFEMVDKRFEQIMSFFWILATIFVAITASTIGFAIWDRRTISRPFETKVANLEEKINSVDIRESYSNLLTVLKKYAEQNKKFADIIKPFNLF